MPKSYYTLIKIAPNHISGDKLSIGLIVFDEKNIKIKFSAERQNIARRLINNGSDTIAYVSHQIEKNLKDGGQKLREKVVVKNNEGQWVTNYMDYLQRYSNGTLQFSEPRLITEELTDQNFEKLFQSLFENTSG